MTPDPAAPILIPLDAIDPGALGRDRSGLDAEPMAELEASIRTGGLRQPIEVFPLAASAPAPGEAPALRPGTPGLNPWSTAPWGLLSGFRRLETFRRLHEATGEDRWAAIPAFVRAPASVAAALAAMVEENEVRADLSPYERGLIAVTARDQGVFASVEEAVNALYASAPRQKRARLRTLALFAEEIGGFLTAPEQLSAQQCYRVAAAVTAGFAELMRTALEESSLKDSAHQWTLLQSILAESEAHTGTPERSPRPGRPRRIIRPKAGVTVRRERTRDGWSLHFTGSEATGMLIDEVIDEIERQFAPLRR